MTLAEVESMLAAAERRFERRVGEARALADQAKRAQAQAEVEKEQMVSCEEAVAFLNSFADERQAQVQQKIEELVTHGLQTIFGDEMTFHVNSEQKANRSEVTFSLRSKIGDQILETPILDARGGGVAAVTGFLLRLIVLMLRSGERPLLALDESFAQLSSGYEPRLAEFLRELVDQTGAQIVLVTHSEAYSEHADKVYRFGQKQGSTTIKVEADTAE